MFSLRRRPFVSDVVDSSRSVMLVLCTFSCNISNTLLSTGFDSGEFGGHRWGGINSGVSFCNNSMVACHRWAFRVLQCSVETVFQVRWELLTWFCSKFIHETVYEISPESPEFVEDITKTCCMYFFRTHCSF